jgi:hypothetical protein
MPTYTTILAFRNAVTSVTASSQHDSLPANNLANAQPFLVWRSTSATTQTLLGNFTEFLPISYLCLYAHNLTPSCTLRLQLYAELDQLSEVYDMTWDAIAPTYQFGEYFGLFFGGYSNEGFTAPFSIQFFNAVAANSFKLTLTGTTEAYYQVGILRLGDYWQAENSNISWGYGIKHNDPSRQSELESGGVFTEKKPSWRTMNIKFEYLTKTDENNLLNLLYSLGKNTPFLVSVYPTEDQTTQRNHTMFAVLSDWSDMTRSDLCSRAISLSLREVK